MNAPPIETRSPGAGGWGRWMAHGVVGLLLLGALEYTRWLIAGGAGSPLRPRPDTQTVGTYLDGPLLLRLAAVLVAGRLIGLLLSPAGRPLQVLERLGQRNSWFAARGDLVAPEMPWRQLNWLPEAGIALALLALTVVVRWTAASLYNPGLLPQGSDHADYLWNAWLMVHGISDGYAHQRFPGFSWLAGQVSSLMGWTLIKGAIATSCAALSLAVVGIYGAVRLCLGRPAAVASSLLFIFTDQFQYFSYHTSSYGLFASLSILAVASMAYLLRDQRPWVWAIIGAFFGLAYTVDMKAVSLALASAPWLVAFALWPWWQNRQQGPRPWGARLLSYLSPALGVIVAISIGGLIHLASVDFLKLEPKLDIQAREVFRDLTPNKDPGSWQPGEALVALPSWPHLLLYNFHRASRGPLANNGLLLLMLAAVGALAPLIQGSGRPWRQRLHGAAGASLMVLALGSSAGAFLLFFQMRYVLHALPFFIGLGCLGCWVLAAWTTPRTAPRAVAMITGGVLIALCSQGNKGWNDFRPLKILAGVATASEYAAKQRDLPELQARRVARWVERSYGEEVPLVFCERGLVATHMRRALNTPPAGNYFRRSCAPLKIARRARRRLWIIEQVPFQKIVDSTLQEPRFKTVLKVSLNDLGPAENHLIVAQETLP